MSFYTPVKLATIYVTVNAAGTLNALPNQAEIEEAAPVCGMTRDEAIAFARAAYGEDAGIMDDDTREVHPL